MHYNEHKQTNEFLDSLAYTIRPRQHTSHSRTLIDNIFSKVISKDIICNNITATISHQTTPASPNTLANPPPNKSSVFERDWSKFE